MNENENESVNESEIDLDLENVVAGDFSLESILAEYKGSAYINGDKKTPPELLNEQTEKILKEVVGSAKSGLLFSTNSTVREVDTDSRVPKNSVKGGKNEAVKARTKPADQNVTRQQPDRIPEARQNTGAQEQDTIIAGLSEPDVETVVADTGEPDFDAAVTDTVATEAEASDNVVLFFENYRSPEPEPPESIMQHVQEAIEREYGDTPRERPAEYAVRDSDISGDSRFSDEDSAYMETEYYEEPDLRDAVKRFATICNSISLRCIPAAIITIMMVIMTFAFEAGLVIPFGIGRNPGLVTGTLMVFLLVVMMLCVDIIVKGASDLTKGLPNVETLILFSCAFSLISGAFAMIWSSSGQLTYCAVSALSLTFSAFGEKYNLRAITETLKTATASSEPYGVQAEYNKEIDKSILKKTFNRTDGFYNNLVHPDVSETAYRYATPVLLAVALVLSVFTVLVKGGGANFLHMLSALFAAAAPFSAVLAFALPFGIIAKSIRKSGAAIAGWGGADDVSFTDGASVTDEDLFPPGTLSLGGMKLFDGISPEKAIRYTSSLIIASGSGLSRVFSEVLKTQGMAVVKVEDFACYETGVSALVRGERVMTGSSAFMDLLGIRIPDELNMKNAVFTAVNNSLAAMFAVDYTPANSVQGALISILKWRIKLFFAVRDFNVTPSMLEQKFRVSLDDIEYPQARDSYSISDSTSGNEGRMAAVLTREGFGPFAEAVAGGLLLKTAALFATGVSVFSAALGLIVMFYMFWTGSFVSARPGNLILFMLVMFIIVMLVCGYAKIKK